MAIRTSVALDHRGDCVTLLEFQLLGTPPCDHRLDQVVTYLDCDMGHHSAKHKVNDLAKDSGQQPVEKTGFEAKTRVSAQTG